MLSELQELSMALQVNSCQTCRTFINCQIFSLYSNEKEVLYRQLSTTSAFFQQTSGRQRRRQRLQQQRQQTHNDKTTRKRNRDSESNNVPSVDTRTVYDILFPGFRGDGTEPTVPPEFRVTWPTSLRQWRTAFSSAWEDYKYTWKGFMTSRGFLVEDDEDKEGKNGESKHKLTEMKELGEQMKNQATLNAQVLNTESESLRSFVREKTGIHSKEDLKRVVGEFLRLFSDCLREFMNGYRKGRDDEVEKMLTEYFQEMESKAANSKLIRKRKRKRRVVLAI